MVTDSEAKIHFLLNKGSHRIKNIIVIGDIPDVVVARAKSQNIRLMTFEEVENIGATKSLPPQVLFSIFQVDMLRTLVSLMF